MAANVAVVHLRFRTSVRSHRRPAVCLDGFRGFVEDRGRAFHTGFCLDEEGDLVSGCRHIRESGEGERQLLYYDGQLDLAVVLVSITVAEEQHMQGKRLGITGLAGIADGLEGTGLAALALEIDYLMLKQHVAASQQLNHHPDGAVCSTHLQGDIFSAKFLEEAGDVHVQSRVCVFCLDEGIAVTPLLESATLPWGAGIHGEGIEP